MQDTSNLSSKINAQQNSVNYSTNTSTIKNYNSNLYQSTPHPYPGPKSLDSYSKQTTISAPKFWPNKNQSMQTSETVKTTYSTPSGGIVNKTVTTNYSTNTYNDSQQIQNISNNFQDTLKLNDTYKPKIPPTTLPKPNLSNWQQNQGLNKSTQQTTTTTTQFKQSTIPAPGQSSFTGSRPAPKRGRGQLFKTQETGRIPICANLNCCQQIRFVLLIFFSNNIINYLKK